MMSELQKTESVSDELQFFDSVLKYHSVAILLFVILSLSGADNLLAQGIITESNEKTYQVRLQAALTKSVNLYPMSNDIYLGKDLNPELEFFSESRQLAMYFFLDEDGSYKQNLSFEETRKLDLYEEGVLELQRIFWELGLYHEMLYAVGTREHPFRRILDELALYDDDSQSYLLKYFGLRIPQRFLTYPPDTPEDEIPFDRKFGKYETLVTLYIQWRENYQRANKFLENPEHNYTQYHNTIVNQSLQKDLDPPNTVFIYQDWCREHDNEETPLIELDGSLGQVTVMYVVNWNEIFEEQIEAKLEDEGIEIIELDEMFAQIEARKEQAEYEMSDEYIEKQDELKRMEAEKKLLEQQGKTQGVDFLVLSQNDILEIEFDDSDKKYKTKDGTEISTRDFFSKFVENGTKGFETNDEGELTLYGLPFLVEGSNSEIVTLKPQTNDGELYIKKVRIDIADDIDNQEKGLFSIDLETIEMDTRDGLFQFIVNENYAKEIFTSEEFDALSDTDISAGADSTDTTPKKIALIGNVQREKAEDEISAREEFLGTLLAQATGIFEVKKNPLDPTPTQIYGGDKEVPLYFEPGIQKDMWSRYSRLFENVFEFVSSKKNCKFSSLNINGNPLVKNGSYGHLVVSKTLMSEEIESVHIQDVKFMIIGVGEYDSDEFFDFTEALLKIYKEDRNPQICIDFITRIEFVVQSDPIEPFYFSMKYYFQKPRSKNNGIVLRKVTRDMMLKRTHFQKIQAPR